VTWRRTRLKYLASIPIVNGLGEAATLEDDSWPRYIRTTDFAGPRELRDETRATLPPDVAKKAEVRRGDILMSAAGTVGRTFLYDSDDPACFAGYLVRFRPRTDLDPRFVSYWTESPTFLDQIETGKVTSTIDNFSAGKYQNLSITVPDVRTQRAIADFLDTETARVDSLIAKKQQLAAALRHRFHAQLEAVIGQSAAPIAAVGRFVRSLGQGSSPQAGTSPATDGEWGVLKLSAVKQGRFEPHENKSLGPEWVGDDALVPRVGDLLITRANTPNLVGDVCAVDVQPEKLMISDLIYRVRLDSRLLPEYAAYALRTADARHQLSSAARGSSQSMVKLRGEDLRQVRLPVPTVEGQREAVNSLDEAWCRARHVLTRIERQLVLLREHRQALIAAAVTGEFEFEVPGVAA
jgi:type I restriction enzyme, S subunit